MKRLLLALLAIISLPAYDSTFASLPSVFIKECYDGDTCTTLKGEKIRLACIDTPELKGKNAKTSKIKQPKLSKLKTKDTKRLHNKTSKSPKTPKSPPPKK